MGTMTVADDLARLREELDAAPAKRKEFVKQATDDVSAMMGDIRARLGELRADVAQMLSDFRDGNAERRAAVLDMLAGFREENVERRKSVLSLLSDVHDEMVRAHKAFYGTAGRQGGAKAAQEPRAPKKAKSKK